MLQSWFHYVRYEYIDSIDPEGGIAKLALRTALACILSMLFFQFMGNIMLSSWAGFAAFAFVQNDTQELFAKKLPFLITIICTFTLVACFSMYLSNYLIAFLVFTPILIFACAYLSTLGLNYFTAGSWCIVIHLLAGDNPANMHQIITIGAVFLISGAISIVVSFFILPIRPEREIFASYDRIFTKLLFLFANKSVKKQTTLYQIKFNAQLDHMLVSQEKNLLIYLDATQLSQEKEEIMLMLDKFIYQFALMSKSTFATQRLLKFYPSYPRNDLANCHYLIAAMIQETLNFIRQKKPPEIGYLKEQLQSYRQHITMLRRFELKQIEPNYTELLAYSNYYYHFLKLEDLLEKINERYSAFIKK